MLGGPSGPRSRFRREWFSVIFSLWMSVVTRAPGIASGIVHLLHIRVLGKAVRCCPDLHYPLGRQSLGVTMGGTFAVGSSTSELFGLRLGRRLGCEASRGPFPLQLSQGHSCMLPEGSEALDRLLTFPSPLSEPKGNPAVNDKKKKKGFFLSCDLCVMVYFPASSYCS